MARKKKIKPMAKLWELPLAEVQKMYDHAAKFGGLHSVVLKRELERTDRSGPQDLSDLYE